MKVNSGRSGRVVSGTSTVISSALTAKDAASTHSALTAPIQAISPPARIGPKMRATPSAEEKAE